MAEPLPFLPKSGYAFYTAEANGKNGLAAAEALWSGKSFNPRERARPERSIATQMALRRRDPFLDGDAGSRERFAKIARAVFAAVEHARPFAVDEVVAAEDFA